MLSQIPYKKKVHTERNKKVVKEDPIIVQSYLTKPYLINGYKVSLVDLADFNVYFICGLFLLSLDEGESEKSICRFSFRYKQSTRKCLNLQNEYGIFFKMNMAFCVRVNLVNW